MTKQTTTATPAPSAEQSADLAALQAFANDAPIIPGTPEAIAAEEAAARPDLAQELGGLITAFVTVAAPILPSLKAIYTPETTQAVSGALAAVCTKHGWMQGGIMGEHAEELTALIVCGPIAFATVQAVRSDLAPKAAKVSAGETAAIEPPAQTVGDDGAVNQRTVIIGSPLESEGGHAD